MSGANLKKLPQGGTGNGESPPESPGDSGCPSYSGGGKFSQPQKKTTQARLTDSEEKSNSKRSGAHLLLFFLAFVFGSFCTFFFHILMYMFEQKCVLFPKIVKHSSLRHVVYEYFSINPENADDAQVSTLPLDFLSTHWVEDSVCYLPTYVPLVSGLFGLIWTTMFLMCSSGTSNPSGMQRQWRALPMIFVFSVAMGGVCVYASSTTSHGLRDLCTKLAEVTGSPSCTYTVNVATLAYERRIRGVYQATQLTVITAWLHTCCWLLSAAITALRVLCAVDFQLVCVKADLIGNIDKMLEKYEEQIRLVSRPESTAENSSETTTTNSTTSSFKISEDTEEAHTNLPDENLINKKRYFDKNSAIYISQMQEQSSELSLVPEERFKLAKLAALAAVSWKHKFIVKIVYDLLETINLRSLPQSKYKIDTSSEVFDTSTIRRQRGQENITAGTTPREALNPDEAEKIAIGIRQGIRDALEKHFDTSSMWNVADKIDNNESSFNLSPELKQAMDTKLEQVESEVGGRSEPSASLKVQLKKSNLKTKGTQAGETHKVQILDTNQSADIEDKDSPIEKIETTETENRNVDNDTNNDSDNNEDKDKKDLSDKETQTTKEKQD